MSAQSEKAREFDAMHRAAGGFILPNPWDVGTARMMAHHGFKALATSSAAFANGLGRADYHVTRDEALEHCRVIAAATELPVIADLEKCFADKPEGVADTVLMASETGIVGCSVEDATGNAGIPLFPFEHAIERVRLAVVAARRLNFPFIITARTEEMLAGKKDLAEAIRRLQAFEKAGAHCVYATGLTSVDQVKQVCAVVKTPVNVMAMKTLDANELFQIGVKRVSLGPWFQRAAYAGLLEAIAEVKDKGTFTFAAKAPSGADISKMMT